MAFALTAQCDGPCKDVETEAVEGGGSREDGLKPAEDGAGTRILDGGLPGAQLHRT